MVRKSNTVKSRTKDRRGYLFDDTPRGLLEALLIGGGIVGGLTFAPTLFAVLAGIGYALHAGDRKRRKNLSNSLQYLKRHKHVQVITREDGEGIRIELTKRGRQHAMHVRVKRTLLQPIERPRVWDKCWRIIIFDIAAEERSKRDAFRLLVRRLGGIMLQKSVWIYPFDCSEQIGLLKSLFDLTDAELRIIIAMSIGDDTLLRKRFRLF
jgi:hypothetical protein